MSFFFMCIVQWEIFLYSVDSCFSFANILNFFLQKWKKSKLHRLKNWNCRGLLIREEQRLHHPIEFVTAIAWFDSCMIVALSEGVSLQWSVAAAGAWIDMYLVQCVCGTACCNGIRSANHAICLAREDWWQRRRWLKMWLRLLSVFCFTCCVPVSVCLQCLISYAFVSLA